MKSNSYSSHIQPGMNNTMTICRHVKPNTWTTAKRTFQLSLRALHRNSNWQSCQHPIHLISLLLMNRKGLGEDMTAVFKYLRGCHTEWELGVFCMPTSGQILTQFKKELCNSPAFHGPLPWEIVISLPMKQTLVSPPRLGWRASTILSVGWLAEHPNHLPTLNCVILSFSSTPAN